VKATDATKRDTIQWAKRLKVKQGKAFRVGARKDPAVVTRNQKVAACSFRNGNDVSSFEIKHNEISI
jgi:hypothetical protein